jgi:predicted Zn-dependent protease
MSGGDGFVSRSPLERPGRRAEGRFHRHDPARPDKVFFSMGRSLRSIARASIPRNIGAIWVILHVFLLSCATTRVELVGADGQTFKPERDEQELWTRAEELERRIDKSPFLYQNPRVLAYLNDVAQKLAAGRIPTAVTPRVKVLRQIQLNAFALPSGAIYINTGLLARMDNEAQLATVLGHELTHFTHRHALKETRNAQNKTVLHESVSSVFVLVGVPPGAGRLWTLAAIQGYSRDMEAEADEVGLQTMVQAGYDPNESPKVFQSLQRDSSDRDIAEPYFFGSHPKLQERIDHYRTLLSTRYAAHSQVGGAIHDERFHAHLDEVVVENAALEIEQGRLKAGKAAIEQVLTRRSQDSRAHFLLGEAYRRSGKSDTEMQQALTAYQRATSLDAAYAEPHRELGLLYRRLRDAENARAAFERYLALRPDAVDASIIRKFLRDLQDHAP